MPEHQNQLKGLAALGAYLALSMAMRSLVGLWGISRLFPPEMAHRLSIRCLQASGLMREIMVRGLMVHG